MQTQQPLPSPSPHSLPTASGAFTASNPDAKLTNLPPSPHKHRGWGSPPNFPRFSLGRRRIWPPDLANSPVTGQTVCLQPSSGLQRPNQGISWRPMDVDHRWSSPVFPLGEALQGRAHISWPNGCSPVGSRDAPPTCLWSFLSIPTNQLLLHCEDSLQKSSSQPRSEEWSGGGKLLNLLQKLPSPLPHHQRYDNQVMCSL